MIISFLDDKCPLPHGVLEALLSLFGFSYDFSLCGLWAFPRWRLLKFLDAGPSTTLEPLCLTYFSWRCVLSCPSWDPIIQKLDWSNCPTGFLFTVSIFLHPFLLRIKCLKCYNWVPRSFCHVFRSVMDPSSNLFVSVSVPFHATQLLLMCFFLYYYFL